MNLPEHLSYLGSIISHAVPEDEISEEDIIRFCEGVKDDRKIPLILQKIYASEEFYFDMKMLRKMVVCHPIQNPTSKMINRVFKTLALTDTIATITLKKVKGLWSILEGERYIYQKHKPIMAFRGKSEDEICFQIDKSPYFILCNIDHESETPNLYFSLETEESTRVKNGRFTIRKGNKRLCEIVTDKMGITNTKAIETGDYEIDVEINRQKIGMIRLNLQ